MFPADVRQGAAFSGVCFSMNTFLVVMSLSLSLMFALARSAGGAEPGPQDADAPKEFQATKSGLKYRVLRKGDGEKPKASDKVEVHYKGWLDNGKVFDSSYARDESIEFGLNQVIPGWTEGVQLIGEGGMIELEIPSNLGYGPRGAGGVIPPNATLHFIVELIDVK
jgi:FKBP-type peptidyl-prolyl cis-trans isomerase